MEGAEVYLLVYTVPDRCSRMYHMSRPSFTEAARDSR